MWGSGERLSSISKVHGILGGLRFQTFRVTLQREGVYMFTMFRKPRDMILHVMSLNLIILVEV
jgi:hypothetical protein